MNLIAITNPSDESAEAGFVHTQVGYIVTDSIIPEYGDKIEDGAQIVIASDGPKPGVWQFIAERVGDDIWIRVNNTLSEYCDTEDVGPSVAAGSVTPEVELKTYTVFGENDECEQFRAVVTAADPAAAKDAGIRAGLVNEGYEYNVDIAAVLEGDVGDIDVTPEANEA